MKGKLQLAIVQAVLAALVLGVGARAAEDWQPYFQNKDKQTPVPANLSKTKDKEWLTIGYPEFPGGFKPRLGVVFSDDKPDQEGMAVPDNEWAKFFYGLSAMNNDHEPIESVVTHVEDIVRQSLSSTGRFTMVERTTALKDVTGEQDAGATGRIEKKTAAKFGQMMGADYVVKATVIEINPEKEAKEIKAIGGVAGSGGLGIGSFGVSGKVAFCRLNVRLVNTSTGVSEYEFTVDGTSSGSGVNVGGGGIGGLGGKLAGGVINSATKKDASMGDALSVCANKIAYFLTLKVSEMPWQGSVARVSPLIINAGTNIGLRAGLELELVSKGDLITDPEDSTASLGYITTTIGRARITDVKEKYSTCEILDGGDGLKVGDFVLYKPSKP